MFTGKHPKIIITQTNVFVNLFWNIFSKTTQPRGEGKRTKRFYPYYCITYYATQFTWNRNKSAQDVSKNFKHTTKPQQNHVGHTIKNVKDLLTFWENFAIISSAILFGTVAPLVCA